MTLVPMAIYDSFAADFEAHALDSAYNAHYDRPAMLELLGPVDGLRVLDAGCGPGLYAQQLVARGASVMGVDTSTELVGLARARLGDRARFRVADLDEGLPWMEDNSFDRVVMALVLHHLQNPVSALRELHRVLTNDGRLVLSTHHPTDDWVRRGGSYFADERVFETWNAGWEVNFRRVPLETLVADFSAAGFVIDALVEPRPAASMEVAHPETYRKLMTRPGFIAFRLMKR